MVVKIILDFALIINQNNFLIDIFFKNQLQGAYLALLLAQYELIVLVEISKMFSLINQH